ncbi:MAG: response regulator transcription factor [Gammaproteobacteria bacterium]
MSDLASPRAKTIRVVIVDDHPVIRFGLSKMLGSDESIEIVAELESISDALSVLSETEFDVMLLDLELSDARGVDAIRMVRDASPGARIIVYTSHEDEDRIVQTAELGAEGYLLKGCGRHELTSAIRTVHRGETALDPGVAAKIMRHMNGRSKKRRQAEALSFSKRERQVLDLLACGKTNRAIGQQLFISESTVKFHMHAILDKLDARNRTQAVSIAAQQGLISMPD